ncbi:MAG TPA: hypothetical protein VFR20_04135 [Burkholderiaceae bacterium]|nr:hypothetical protein [Burkholderiaceae bacterium]
MERSGGQDEKTFEVRFAATAYWTPCHETETDGKLNINLNQS